MESNLAGGWMAGSDIAGSLRNSGLQYHMPVGAGTLKIALLNPSLTGNPGLDPPGAHNDDMDSTLPKIEVSYDTKISRVAFGLFGGYNTSSYEYHATVVGDPSYSYDLDSWALGGWFNFDLKPAYIKGGVYTGTNLANYGWNGLHEDGLFALGYGSGPTTWGIADVDYLSYGLVAGFVANDMLTLEGWWWHVESDRDYTLGATTIDVETEGDQYGVLAVIKLAPNVYIYPEIAVQDRKQRTTTINGVANVIPVEYGTSTIVGIYWKINF
jgi:hypothetical protein